MDAKQPGFFEKIGQNYESIWKLLIKPEKLDYSPQCLGMPTQFVSGRTYRRIDYQVANHKGFLMECTYYEPVRAEKATNTSVSTGVGSSDGLLSLSSANNTSG